MPTTSPSMDDIRAQAKAAWTAGDFGRIAKFSEPIAEAFVARRDIRPGDKVLDVACGTGNVAIPAAKRGAIVSALDAAPNLLQQARARARTEDVRIQFDEGDFENLPYRDGSFDLVLSMFGVIFAPRPERAAAELVRVTKPGGHIVLANWTPGSFIAEMLGTIARYSPPPDGAPNPLLWGEEKWVREFFRDGVRHLRAAPILVHLTTPLPVADTVEYQRQYLGPAKRAFDVLPPGKQTQLRRELEAMHTAANTAKGGTTSVEGEYLEVVVTRA